MSSARRTVQAFLSSALADAFAIAIVALLARAHVISGDVCAYFIGSVVFARIGIEARARRPHEDAPHDDGPGTAAATAPVTSGQGLLASQPPGALYALASMTIRRPMLAMAAVAILSVALATHATAALALGV